MTPEPKTDNTKIACDESGNTGENLTQGQFGVFSEGSHDLSLEEATELMAWLRAELKTQASEIKWKQVKSSPWVFEELFGERLAMRSQFYLTEKLYFVVGKVIDLLLEESIHDKGGDLHSGGQARDMALVLYRDGSRALGAEKWKLLLQSFNSLMRIDTASQRLKAVPKASVEDFFDLIDDYKWRATRRNVSDILVSVSRTRPQAEEFVRELQPDSTFLPALDPLIPSLAQTIRHWYEQGERKPIDVLHDAGPLPSSAAMDHLIWGLEHPGEFRRMTPPIRVEAITAVDSATDARIQVADLVAGFGAMVGGRLLSGGIDDSALSLARSMVAPTSLWGDEASGEALGLVVG